VGDLRQTRVSMTVWENWKESGTVKMVFCTETAHLKVRLL
jgi:hypothetical protein